MITKSQEISNWHKYCNGEEINSSDFYTLLMETSENHIKQIFEPIPFYANILGRFNRIQKIKILDSLNEGEVEKSIIEDLKFKLEILEELEEDELVQTINQAKSQFNYLSKQEFYDKKEEEQSWVETEIISIVGQEFIFTTKSNFKRIRSGLTEAIYGIASNYNIVWYVLAPYTQESFLKTESYVSLWEQGIEYFVSEDSINIYKRN
jgi:hypothetical protein